MRLLYSIKNLNNSASIKDVDGKKGIVTGYFAHFNNVDSDGDIIMPGAFSKTIRENGPQSSTPRIKYLLNHNTGQPLGRLTNLSEDAKGLAYEAQTGSHSLGVDFVKMVDSGLITEHSIGYKTLKSDPLQSWEEYNKNPALGLSRLTEVKLWEGSSLTAWGANELTPITSLKSNDKDAIQELINRQKNLEKFCRNSDASDETIELLLLECKQLTQIIFDISEKSTKPDDTTLPGERIASVFDTFIHKLKTA